MKMYNIVKVHYNSDCPLKWNCEIWHQMWNIKNTLGWKSIAIYLKSFYVVTMLYQYIHGEHRSATLFSIHYIYYYLCNKFGWLKYFMYFKVDFININNLIWVTFAY